VPEAGFNVIDNGGFESPLDGTWTTAGNHSNSIRTTETSHNGSASLKVVSTGVGSGNFNYVRQFIPDSTSNEVYTLSFWVRRTAEDTGSTLYSRTAPGSLFQLTTDVAPLLATPGLSNSAPTDLPPYDPIWLNEISIQGPDRWIELYNNGTNTVGLSDYSIATIFGFNAQPLAAQPDVAPGEFRVIPLLAQPSPGRYALWRRTGTHSQIMDYLNFDSDLYGAVPDGQPFTRLDFRYPTKRLSNLSPRIKSIQGFPGIVYIRFEVYPGHRYHVEFNDNLDDSAWQSLGAEFAATAPEHEIADSIPSTGQRFYRLSYVNPVEQ
jgi:hypothetical protein